MASALRVLLLEDNPADAELVLRELRRAGFTPDPHRVASEREFLAALERKPELVLSDYALPGFDGMRALQLFREHGLDVPFIIVSGTIGEERAVAAVRDGAADYLLKDRLARLGSAVTHALEQHRLRRERQRVEQELREHEARYQALIRTAMDGFAVLDLTGRLREISDRGCEIVGYSRDELRRMTLDDLDNACLPDSDSRAILADIAAHGRGRLEIRHRRASGDLAHFELSVVFLPDRQVNLSFIRDLTETRRLEAQFLRAQRLESVGRLAGGIAHDLNNILSPVLIGAGLLRSKVNDDDARGLLETIQASAQRGAAIIRQLLVFSRGAEGVHAPVRLAGLVRDMAHIMRETFPKNIVLAVNFPADSVVAKGDATQLHQVLMNLCVNARDAMPEGGTLTLKVESVHLDDTAARAVPDGKPGSYVVITVSDTGTGIDPDHLDQIFDPFFTTKEVGRGTGLGLSTVLGIVKSHGGFIQVSSRLQAGTEFRVFLPSSSAEQPEPTPPRAELGPVGHGELILVVDDEVNVRRVVRQTLEFSGYCAMEAEDGVAGLAAYQENREKIRAIVTDVMMPRMDGVRFVRALRNLAVQLPIIAITGVDRSTHVDELKALGVHAVVRKPFTTDVFLRALQSGFTRTRVP